MPAKRLFKCFTAPAADAPPSVSFDAAPLDECLFVFGAGSSNFNGIYTVREDTMPDLTDFRDARLVYTRLGGQEAIVRYSGWWLFIVLGSGSGHYGQPVRGALPSTGWQTKHGQSPAPQLRTVPRAEVPDAVLRNKALRAFSVSGAGSREVDGRYSICDISNGRASYRKAEGETLTHREGRWQLVSKAGEVLYRCSGDAPVPPSGEQWIASRGLQPAPSVLDQSPIPAEQQSIRGPLSLVLESGAEVDADRIDDDWLRVQGSLMYLPVAQEASLGGVSPRHVSSISHRHISSVSPGRVAGVSPRHAAGASPRHGRSVSPRHAAISPRHAASLAMESTPRRERLGASVSPRHDSEDSRRIAEERRLAADHAKGGSNASGSSKCTWPGSNSSASDVLSDSVLSDGASSAGACAQPAAVAAQSSPQATAAEPPRSTRSTHSTPDEDADECRDAGALAPLSIGFVSARVRQHQDFISHSLGGTAQSITVR